MEKIFLEVLDIIGKSKLNDYILLIGSWSEFLYEECNVIRGFVSNIKTGDIDFLIGNVNKPRESIDIISEFQKQDFVIEMATN